MADAAMFEKHVTQGREKRRACREGVSLPVLIEAGGRQQSAQLHNLSESGAMLEATVPLRPGTSLVLNCGAIGAKAIVVWESRPRLGVRFMSMVSALDIAQQVLRSQAAASRRERRKLEKSEADGAVSAH